MQLLAAPRPDQGGNSDIGGIMGEIIYALGIGALLVATGITMNAVLWREEKRIRKEPPADEDGASGKRKDRV